MNMNEKLIMDTNVKILDSLKITAERLDEIGDECKRLSVEMNLKILQARLLQEKLGGKE